MVRPGEQYPDADLRRSEIVRQTYRELFAGRLLMGLGGLLSGVGVVTAVQYENPTMLCFTIVGGLMFVAGKSLRVGAVIFGQRAFDTVDDTPNPTLPPGDQY